MAWLLCVQEEKEDLQQQLFSCDGLAVVCVQEEKEDLQQQLFSCDGLAVVCAGGERGPAATTL